MVEALSNRAVASIYHITLIFGAGLSAKRQCVATVVYARVRLLVDEGQACLDGGVHLNTAGGGA